MATATIKVDGEITGLVTGRKPLSYTLTTSKGTLDVVTLASGANTVTYQSGSQLVVVAPPSANTIAMTLKGASGDTGVALHPTNPSQIAVHTSTSAFLISAGGTISNVEIIAV